MPDATTTPSEPDRLSLEEGFQWPADTVRQSFDLGEGIHTYGAGYDHPTCSNLEGFVYVGGLVKRVSGSWSPGRLIGRLPEEFAPVRRLAFNVNQHDHTARVDIFPNGEIQWIAGREDLNWVSLDGIGFSRLGPVETGPRADLEFGPGMGNYDGGGGYARAEAAVTGGGIYVQGSIQRDHGTWKPSDPTVIGRLPLWAWPKRTHVFNVNRHEQTGRVDVRPDGIVIWRSGLENGLRWVNLNGITFSLAPPERLALSSEMAPYPENHGYTPPGYTQVNTSVRLQGLVRRRTPAWSRHQIIARLPAEIAPEKTGVFNVNQHNATARVDVRPDGAVVWRAGDPELDWISLDGICFVRPR